VQKVYVHREQCRDLIKRAAEVVRILDQHVRTEAIEDVTTTEAEISAVKKTLERILDDLDMWVAKGFRSSWWHRNEIALQLKRHERELAERRDNLTLEAGLAAASHGAKVVGTTTRIEGSVHHLKASTDATSTAIASMAKTVNSLEDDFYEFKQVGVIAAPLLIPVIRKCARRKRTLKNTREPKTPCSNFGASTPVRPPWRSRPNSKANAKG